MLTLNKLIHPFRTLREIRELKSFEKQLKKTEELKLVIGSAAIYQTGWLATEQHFFDLLKEEAWSKYFSVNSIDRILAEHVWEHLTPEQGKRGIQLCYRYLKPGGKLRIAVPDGFNPDHDYHEYAKPGGSGAGADDHKIFYTVESLGQALAEAGFQVEKIEYFDSSGVFHQNNWSESDGYIHRSLANDPRNKDGKPNYTSLIIDGVKP